MFFSAIGSTKRNFGLIGNEKKQYAETVEVRMEADWHQNVSMMFIDAGKDNPND